MNEVRLFDLCRKYSRVLGNCPRVLNRLGFAPVAWDRHGNHLYDSSVDGLLGVLAANANTSLDQLQNSFDTDEGPAVASWIEPETEPIEGSCNAADDGATYRAFVTGEEINVSVPDSEFTTRHDVD